VGAGGARGAEDLRAGIGEGDGLAGLGCHTVGGS
jgi:hypothetical protein